jgi:DNA-binding transcriptional MerR regulator
MGRMRTISEVASLTGINESTLRNWEREFSEYLVVSRDDQGARMYVEGDIERFKMIQLMRKKGLSIGAIRDLLAAFKSGEISSKDTALQVATAMEIVPKKTEQIKELEVLQKTLQQLPEQVKNMVREELQRELTKHQEQVTEQIGEVMKTRVEKYRKPRRAWWKFGTRLK